MRRGVLVLVAASAALGIASESVVFGWADPWRWLPDLVTGWLLLGSGVTVWASGRARGQALLMLATGAAWFLAVSPATLYLHRGPLLHLLITFPGWRPRSRVPRAAVATAYLAALVAPLWSNPGSAVLLAVALVAIVARPGEWGRSSPARRVAVVATVVFAADVAATALLPSGDYYRPALLTYETVVAATAVVLAAVLLTAPRRHVADLVVELTEDRGGRDGRDLADVLGDPSLVVGYWSAVEGAYLSREGARVSTEPGDGRAVTFVGPRSDPAAVLVHDPEALLEPEVADAVDRAALLSRTHVELQDELRARRDELAASRHRLLLAADGERSRLSEQLVDGPVARLRAVAAELARVPLEALGTDVAPHVERARGHLARLLAELDALTAGLMPLELRDGGLPSALTALCGRSPVPVELDAESVPLPDEVATAAYFVCAEALTNAVKHAHATRIRVAAHRRGPTLVLEVVDDGVGGADPTGSGVVGLVDRVETLGGTVALDSVPGRGTRVVAHIPLSLGPVTS